MLSSSPVSQSSLFFFQFWVFILRPNPKGWTLNMNRYLFSVHTFFYRIRPLLSNHFSFACFSCSIFRWFSLVLFAPHLVKLLSLRPFHFSRRCSPVHHVSFTSANPMLLLPSFLHQSNVPILSSYPFPHPLLTIMYMPSRCSSLISVFTAFILPMFFLNSVFNSPLQILLLLRWFLASHTLTYKLVSVICRYMFVNSWRPCNPSLKVRVAGMFFHFGNEKMFPSQKVVNRL